MQTSHRQDAPALAGGAESSAARLWTGRILTAIAVLFLVFDLAVKLFQAPAAMDATMALGYPASAILPIGLVELACLVVYLVPRTTVLGAVLWTGYLGGAVASQVRAGNPLFSHVLFPIYVAALIWGGLWLRDRRARAILGPRRG
jgi:hypothetical protein